MIHENSPVTNTFVSVPADMGHLNCAAFIAGIIAGALDSARFVRLRPPFRSAVVANLTHFPVISFLIVWCIERKGYRALGGVGDWYRPHHFLSQIRTRGTRVSDPVVAS